MSSNTPQLRFAEFRGEWQETPIKVIGEVIGGGTPSTAITEYWNGDINWYTPSEIGKTRFINKSERRISNTGLKNSSAKLLPIGTILLTSRATIGEMSILKEIGCTNQGFQSIVVNNSNDRDFIYYSLSRIKNELIKKSSGSTFLEISANKIREIEFFAPKSAEQQKIGSFLSAVDSKIEGLEQELGLLKRYKQGIMQRLFNQTIRFKDNNGNPFPAWQDVSIKEIGEVITGSTPSKTNDGFWEGSFPWATAQDFKSKYISTTIQTLSEQGKKKSRIIPKNSVLITCIASIGLNAINKVECATNQQINAIVCNEKYDSEFIYYAIGFNNRSLKNLAGQTAVPIVTKTAFESFRLFIAKDKVEQKKIADFLSSIDEKIEAKQNQITTARNWKKSLLQKMFV